ncbi:hypothetical protein [Moraxella nonliquefaciens]|uniref:hypothetical protein n=1 Tax=Moraxella nonliquefaciens TaxID=478 RepID=UPI003EE2587F
MLTKFTALAMGVLLSVSAMAADMATLTRQAQSGDAAAQSDLADEYYKQGNHAKAFEWYTNAAHQGFAEAQNDLGWMYEKAWACVKMIKGRWNGLPKPPIKGMHKPNLIWA